MVWYELSITCGQIRPYCVVLALVHFHKGNPLYDSMQGHSKFFQASSDPTHHTTPKYLIISPDRSKSFNCNYMLGYIGANFGRKIAGTLVIY